MAVLEATPLTTDWVLMESQDQDPKRVGREVLMVGKLPRVERV